MAPIDDTLFGDFDPAAFNSDEELSGAEERPIGRYAHAGERTIEQMAIHAREDRVASARRLKNLTDSAGAASTVYASQLWFNLYTAFCKVTNRDPTSVPTGQDILRFVLHIVERMKPRSREHTQIRRGTIRKGVASLNRHLQFLYKDFQFTPHDGRRIDAAIQELVNSGKLIIGKTRSLERVGFYVIRRMVISYFTDCLTNGVWSWDAAISRVTSVVLQSMLVARAGEVVRSVRAPQDAYLKWQDIRVELEGGDIPDDNNPLDHILVTVKICYEKGSKDDPTKFRSVELNLLQDNESIPIDPILLLFTLALRTEQVEAKDLAGIIQRMKDHPFHRLQWNFPTRPVIAALSKETHTLILDKPASLDQVSTTLDMLADVSGALVKLWSHDVRRGAIGDLNRLNRRVQSGVDPSVAAAAGHTFNAFARGTTDDYAGRVSTNLHAAREEMAEEKRAKRGIPDMVTQPFKRVRKSTKQINDFASHEDHSSHRDSDTSGVPIEVGRQCLGKRLAKKTREAWWDTARDTYRRNNASTTNLLSTLQESMETQFVTRHDGSSKGTDGRVVWDCSWLESFVSSEAESDLFLIDNDTRRCFSDLANQDTIDEDLADAIDTDNLCTALETPFLFEAVSFVNYFAKINVVLRLRYVTKQQLIDSGCLRGGSRDEPTQFTRACENAAKGCGHTFYDMRRRTKHQKTACVFRAGVNSKLASDYLERQSIRYHAAAEHGIPAKNVVAHMVKDKTEQPTSFLCEFRDVCKNDTLFYHNHLYLYRMHLERSQHGMTREEALKFAPLTREPVRQKSKSVRGKWTPRPCPLTNCKMTGSNFLYDRGLFVHLQNIHNLDIEVAEEIVHQLCIGNSDVIDQFGLRDTNTTALEVGPAMEGDETAETKKGHFCPLTPCSLKGRPLASAAALAIHLRSPQHRVSMERANEIAGSKSKAHAVCPKCDRDFATKRQVRDHLMTRLHVLSELEANTLVYGPDGSPPPVTVRKGRRSGSDTGT